MLFRSLDTPPPHDALPVTCEVAAGVDVEVESGLAAEIERQIKTAFGATARVTLVANGTLPVTEGKTKRVQRSYEKANRS